MINTVRTAKIKDDKNGYYSIIISDGEGKSFEYSNVTRDLCSLETLARIINAGEVSRIHIEEILEDIIG